MRFERYELLARLGAGGMGEVWRARDHELRREVAVKFLPERFAADPVRMSRFTQEALAASRLNHPNIVTIHDSNVASGMPYIVMELVEGETLRQLSQEGRALPLRRALDVAAQVAEGLAKAHAAGIVHRDLKPENVMVSRDGFVKILDFGLAKLRSLEPVPSGEGHDSGADTWPESASPQTAGGVLLGTVGYMSPEQACGRAVDYRSDQFALGAILYELVTGRQAFRRDTTAQTLAAIIEDEPPPIAGLNPQLPPALRWLIEKRCLAKDPAERYASTQDLARELRDQRDHLQQVSAGGAASAAGAVRRRRAWLPWLAALALAAVAALAVWRTPLLERAAVALRLRPMPSEKRLAVLPFRPVGSTAEEREVADGLGAVVAARLAGLEKFQDDLSVEPAANVLQSGATTGEQAARALGATLVVSGTVSRSGGRLYFTATLEDAARRRALRAAEAASAEDLVDRIVAMVEPALEPPARAALDRGRSGVAEATTLTVQGLAYTPYAEGRGALERYEQARSLDRAIELFNRALERDPGYALAHAGIGEAYWRRYVIERRPELVTLAERHASRALQLDDLAAGPWLTLGMVHAGSGRAEQAVADLRQALDRDPRSAEVHRELARAYQKLSRFGEAEAAYRQAIALRPQSWAAYNYLGIYLAGRGRLREAEAALRQALERAPENARAWSNLGGVLIYEERPAEAEEALRHALRVGGGPDAVSNLASLQFHQGRYGDAARTFEDATAQGSRDYRLWRNLGAARWWAPGERARAAEAYRRAVPLLEAERKVDPGDGLLAAHLADCHAMLAEAQAARALAAEAVSLAPADGEVAQVAAGVYETLGDRRQALEQLSRALRNGYPPAMVDSDPTFAELRKDPRYAAVAARAGRH